MLGLLELRPYEGLNCLKDLDGIDGLLYRIQIAIYLRCEENMPESGRTVGVSMH